MHFLNGVEIAKTEIGRDPKMPVAESDVVKLLSWQSKRKAGLLNQLVHYSDLPVFREKVSELIDEGCTLFVCDAETVEDLKQIVSRFSDWKTPLLWAGSAGQAEHLVHVQRLKAEEIVLEPAGTLA